MTVTTILSLVENYGWGLAPLVLYGLYWLRYLLKRKPLQTGPHGELAEDLADPLSRARAIARITAPNPWDNRYRGSLDGLLVRLDRWFGVGYLNPRALHLCYLLALVYPLLFVFLDWLVTGEGDIGTLELFHPDIAWQGRLWRGALIIGGAASVGLAVFLLVSGKLHGWIQARLPIAWLAGPIFWVAAVIAGAIALVIVDGAGGVAGFGALLLVLAPMFIALALAGAGAFVSTFTFAFAVAVAVAVAVTGAFAFAVAVIIGFTLIAERLGESGLGFGFSGLFVLLAVLLAPWLLMTLGEPERLAKGMLAWTAWLFLPAINALFDVASLQVSRFLLGKIRADGRVPNIVWMVVDVIAAVALLVGLYSLIFLSLGAVDRWLFPEETIFPVARWRELFWGTRDWFHAEILWLTLMALTTLTVTGLHLIFVFAHLFAPLRHTADRRRIAGLIATIEAEAKDNEGRAGTDRCRRLATAYYLPWEHGIVLGTLTLWGIGYILYALAAHG
uniref:Uncharacterized protein n=1 Tax=Candidatus Kentrum sp. FM TaxID=2126340 RepID=A0A450S4V7_9GAMM|nr:MAG: hypothetical protein BECKFM1743A_GA0114220_100413 [Candidatus Kentron sp. FM]VFJ47258.1 MAG: hypothetical protein BECKFM1743C_GA0114222_100433 [Candidatus Kentron sp. FM]VFK07161.1 MAG: hypothetical protein BECKFM1743B_GA0114221_1003312 [Candidatus Kentron sp. FM]